MRRLAVLALLCAAVPVQADYVYDPADLPAGFECEKDWSEQKCAEELRFEAWWDKYEERYDFWFHDLLFDTDVYFDDYVPLSPAVPGADDYWDASTRLSHPTRNLVDAVYSISLRRYGSGWAFAINQVCDHTTAKSKSGCAPRLRMVSPRTRENADMDLIEKFKGFRPISLAETAMEVRVFWAWQEADLRSCPGALDHLLSFPAQRGKLLWDPEFVSRLRDKPHHFESKETGDILVTADGDAVFVRASGRNDPRSRSFNSIGDSSVIYSQANGGVGYEWAKEMARIVQPCLKPATAPAPWDKVVATQGQVGR